MIQKVHDTRLSSTTCIFQGETVNIEDGIADIQTNEPVVCAFGKDMSTLAVFKLVIEKDNAFDMPTLSVAIHCCFSAYYIYNITFPQPLSHFLVFLECHVYKMKPSQKPSLSIATLVDSLCRETISI